LLADLIYLFFDRHSVKTGKRQRKKQADATVEHHERFSESPLYFLFTPCR